MRDKGVFCRDKACLVSTTEEQRRYGQKDQDLVFNGFSGNDTIIGVTLEPERFLSGAMKSYYV